MNSFRKLFSREESREQTLHRAFAALREGVANAAERKLGRCLSPGEKAGIEQTKSLLLLESCERSFVAENYTPAQVERDIASLAAQAKR